MRGEYRADNIGKWSWSNIRTVNFMLARTGRVEGDRGEIDHYIGLARMFRALVYYSKVKDYSMYLGIAMTCKRRTLIYCISRRTLEHWW